MLFNSFYPKTKNLCSNYEIKILLYTWCMYTYFVYVSAGEWSEFKANKGFQQYCLHVQAK